MERNLYFTEAQLKKLTRKDLVRICRYYKLKFTKKTKKEELIRLIWNSFNAPEVVDTEEVEVPMSVRIRRIKESNS